MVRNGEHAVLQTANDNRINADREDSGQVTAVQSLHNTFNQIVEFLETSKLKLPICCKSLSSCVCKYEQYKNTAKRLLP